MGERGGSKVWIYRDSKATSNIGGCTRVSQTNRGPVQLTMTDRNKQVAEILKQSYALSAEGLDEEHENLLRKAILEHPENPDFKLRLAVSIFRRDPIKAKELLHNAVELAHNDPNILAQCGALLFELDEIDEAVKYARQASDLISDDHSGLPLLGYLLGQIANKKGFYDDAERLLKSVFDTEPAVASHGLELALLYYNTSRLEEALDTVDRALKYNAYNEGLLSLRAQIIDAIEEQD